MFPLSNHHKTALLRAIQREWDALLNVVERLSPAQMTTPDSGGWSPKDNLAHLAEWMNVLLGYHIDKRLPNEVLGMPEDIVKDWVFAIGDDEETVINSALFERNKNRPTAEVLAELKEAYATLTARLESMSIDDLMKPRRADDPQKRPLVLWILGDTTEHFAEHRATIEKALK
jgi:hypothetical protein